MDCKINPNLHAETLIEVNITLSVKVCLMLLL